MDIPYLNAQELLVAYRSRTISPPEVVEALAARIEESEPSLNAWAATAFEEARAAAGESERSWARQAARPLEGVPFGVKDLFDTEGCRTAYSSPMFDSNVPRR